MDIHFPKAHPSKCCATYLLPATKPIHENGVVWRLKKCLACGYVVREILKVPGIDPSDYDDLRYMLRHLSTRGMSGTWSRYLNSVRHTAPEKAAE